MHNTKYLILKNDASTKAKTQQEPGKTKKSRTQEAASKEIRQVFKL